MACAAGLLRSRLPAVQVRNLLAGSTVSKNSEIALAGQALVVAGAGPPPYVPRTFEGALRSQRLG